MNGFISPGLIITGILMVILSILIICEIFQWDKIAKLIKNNNYNDNTFMCENCKDDCTKCAFKEELNNSIKKSINIGIKKLNNDINTKFPKKTNEFAAGFDIYANIIYKDNKIIDNLTEVSIQPGERVIFGTNYALEIPEGYYLDICPRSGNAINRGLQVANSPARIDSDYRGEILVGIRNTSNDTQLVHLGDRIAQCTLHKIIPTNFKEVNELSNTKRNNKGLGSSGN